MSILLYTFPASARLKDFSELKDNCGTYCYTENSGPSDFVAYCLETYCYDSFEEIEYKNNGPQQCESTQEANEGPKGCWLNTGPIGMDNVRLTIVCAPKNLLFDNYWEIFFYSQPNYLSGSDLNKWSEYYYDDDVGGLVNTDGKNTVNEGNIILSKVMAACRAHATGTTHRG